MLKPPNVQHGDVQGTEGIQTIKNAAWGPTVSISEAVCGSVCCKPLSESRMLILSCSCGIEAAWDGCMTSFVDVAMTQSNVRVGAVICHQQNSKGHTLSQTSWRDTWGDDPLWFCSCCSVIIHFHFVALRFDPLGLHQSLRGS